MDRFNFEAVRVFSATRRYVLQNFWNTKNTKATQRTQSICPLCETCSFAVLFFRLRRLQIYPTTDLLPYNCSFNFILFNKITIPITATAKNADHTIPIQPDLKISGTSTIPKRAVRK